MTKYNKNKFVQHLQNITIEVFDREARISRKDFEEIQELIHSTIIGLTDRCDKIIEQRVCNEIAVKNLVGN